MKNLQKHWMLITWCAVIFFFSSLSTMPKVGFIWWDFLLKKSAHVFEYAVLFFLAVRSTNKKNNFQTAFLFGIAFALSDEFHQSFVPGRTPKFTDVGFDTAGLFIAFLFIKSKYLPNLIK